MKRVKPYYSKYDNGKHVNCPMCDDARSDIEELYVMTPKYVKGSHSLTLCKECFFQIKNGAAHQ